MIKILKIFTISVEIIFTVLYKYKSFIFSNYFFQQNFIYIYIYIIESSVTEPKFSKLTDTEDTIKTKGNFGVYGVTVEK